MTHVPSGGRGMSNQISGLRGIPWFRWLTPVRGMFVDGVIIAVLTTPFLWRASLERQLPLLIIVVVMTMAMSYRARVWLQSTCPTNRRSDDGAVD